MKKILILGLTLLIFCCAQAQQKIKVACVGNSITYGYLLPDREQNAYPFQLQRMLGDRYEVGNFGKSGATLLNKGHRPYMQQEEFRQAMAFAGDIAVIHLGANDTDPRNWPNYRDEFVHDYLALIDSLRSVNPDCRFLIARLSPIFHSHPRFESGTRDWQAEVRRSTEWVAQYAGAQLIDFHEPLYAHPHLLPDALHPSAEGATILARTVYASITGDFGGLQLPEVYSDNMVLQHGAPLRLHGVADAGSRVTVKIGKQKHTATTDANGKWDVMLDPLKAGGPYVLTVSDKSRTLTYKNVLAGEVWLCSGQSNMEFMLKESHTGTRDIPQAGNDQIRLLDLKARWRTDNVAWEPSALDSINYLQYFTQAHWEVCTPEQAADFSAVAYYFGKALQDSLNVPVGLICNAVGGSPAEAWIDRRTLEYEFPAVLRDWKNNDFIQGWVRGRAATNIQQSKNKLQRHPYEPCYLYEAGILPLQQFPIKGVIWYQGESNAHNREAHERLFKLLVQSWRANWQNEEMPFYFAQLSSLNRPSWPWFRDSQRKLLAEIPYTGMAVTSDQGDSLDVHPRAKQPVGERLARWALHNAYGKHQVVPSGPLFREAETQGNVMYLSFDYAEGLHSSDGEALRTFEVAEVEGVYHSAVAEIEGNRIKVYSDRVKNPRHVRYGWQPFTRANLVNQAGLPASTFRTEWGK